ncbi:MAG: hypothetical protein U0169_11135 [Polyangiaceae bacterium]
MTTGALVPCVHEGRFAVCGVAAFGVLDATSDAPNPRDASAFHVALGPRVTFEVPLHSRVAFRTHADLLFVPTGQTFEVAGRPVMDLSRVAGVVGLGVVVRVDP